MPQDPTTSDLEEAIRRLTEAANRRDFDGGLAMYSQDAVVDNTPIGAGVFEGREAIRGFFEDWGVSSDYFEQALEEVHDLGNGVTFGLFLMRGQLAGSSGFVETRDRHARIVISNAYGSWLKKCLPPLHSLSSAGTSAPGSAKP
jgi:ketosteroid isomerase-like protein